MELERLVSELVKFKTYSNQELRECASFIAEYFKDQGYSPRVKEYEPGYPVVIVDNGKEGRQVLLNGHFDVVPPGDLSKWSVDPFSGDLKGGKVFGRGSADMKGGLATLMEVFVEVAEKVDYSLVFTAVPDEETGGQRGTRHLSEKFSPTFVIVGEPTQGMVNVGEKGLFQVKVIERGKSAHGSTPSLGDNAIMKLVKDLEALEGVAKIVTELQEVLEASKALADVDPLIAKELLHVSFNPGVIKGGSKVNVVPDYAEAEVDMRVPPGVPLKRVEEYVRSSVRGDVQIIDSSHPTISRGELVEKFKKAVGGKAYISTYATDGRYFRFKGVPTVVYGPGELKVLHSYDEYVSVEELRLTEKRVKEFLLGF
ncbi:MAG: succinyl-diaminopimelate desuccinylase [Candidatus Aramenus sulfurataquae]|jgi:succinyl-diaminopimelate desuccinylase|uniref:M20 family metallopeptidase n=3 Tax=Candidatus Aramenus sulfurataquae TaxID=1326980 RepID=A0ACC6TPS8_9CREN|nr:MAG: succinyl-diaminopimelate desuccinylase [Candidatus Aramenus sulfurataquae]MCL7344289.1 M20 family metallopeptidase [Candidatus Aramenus sulfurataquae]